MFSMHRRRPLRTIARTTLWLWLFAFLVGVANACVVRADAHGPAAPSWTVALDTQHVDGGRADAALDTCKHSCARDQGPLAKASADTPDEVVGVWGYPETTPLRPAGIAGPRAPGARPLPPPGPPVAIRFLRLTI